MRWIGREQALATGLIVCVSAAVLAFGGTEPFAWAVVQTAAFLLFGVVLWTRGTENPGSGLPWRGPALLAGYLSLQAVLVHPDRHLAREALLRLLACLCVFGVSACVCRNRKGRVRMTLGLLALGLFEALYGLVQYLSGWPYIFAYKKVFYLTQATGTYINPNHFSGLLEMILPMSLAWTLYRLAGIRTDTGGDTAAPHASPTSLTPAEGIARWVFLCFTTLLFSAGILFSRSRAGILSAGVAVSAMLVVWLCFSWDRRVAILGAVALVAATFVFGMWIGLEPVWDRYASIDSDSASRLSVWKDTMALLRTHPLLGTGPGTFADAYTRVQSTLLNRMVDHAHNDYLELAAEWGVPGAALLFGFVLVLFAQTIPACFRSPEPDQRFLALGSCGSILAILLHSTVDFNLQIPANALVLSAILGMAWAVRTAGAPARDRKEA